MVLTGGIPRGALPYAQAGFRTAPVIHTVSYGTQAQRALMAARMQAARFTNPTPASRPPPAVQSASVPTYGIGNTSVEGGTGAMRNAYAGGAGQTEIQAAAIYVPTGTPAGIAKSFVTQTPTQRSVLHPPTQATQAITRAQSTPLSAMLWGGGWGSIQPTPSGPSFLTGRQPAAAAPVRVTPATPVRITTPRRVNTRAGRAFFAHGFHDPGTVYMSKTGFYDPGQTNNRSGWGVGRVWYNTTNTLERWLFG